MHQAPEPVATGARIPPRAVLVADRWVRYALIAGVLVYQRSLGYVMGGQCRFHPSCSHYALDALRAKPSWRAVPLIAWRLLRCQPLCKGGWDELRIDPRDEIYRLLVVEKVGPARPRLE